MKKTRHPANPELVNNLIKTAHEHPDMLGFIIVVPQQRQDDPESLAVDCSQAWNMHPMDVATLLELEAMALRAKFRKGGESAFTDDRRQAITDFEREQGRGIGG